jgi:hypothetical protein
MIQLPQLQEALLVASDGMVARSRRRAQRFRLGLMTTVAVAGIGGGAVASQSIWGPVVGLDAARRPSVSSAPAPPSQQALLSVLRRPQTAADRSSASQQALRLTGRRYRDVRITDVRVIGGATASESVVLVPVGEVKGRSKAAGRPTTGDALCLFTVDARKTAAQACFTESAVRDGTGRVLSGTQLAGVVPDGVSVVRFAAPGRGAFDVPVHDNTYSVLLRRLQPGSTLAWRRADGSAAAFSRGGTTRALPAIPVGFTGMSPSLTQHDCGTSGGGIVPKAVRCGAPARAYVARQTADAERDARRSEAASSSGG